MLFTLDGITLALKAAIRSSVPKLASYLLKRYAKTLQTPPTAQLALIEACLTLSLGSIAGNVMRVKAFLPFLKGIPARNTELHRAYPGWLVGKTHLSFT